MGSLYASIVFFGLTAIFGMYLLSLILRSKSTPKGVVAIHGFLAVLSLVLLIVFTVENKSGPWVSIVIFSVAAMGGFILTYRDITGKSVPKWLGIVHGLLAIAGFSYLTWYAFC